MTDLALDFDAELPPEDFRRRAAVEMSAVLGRAGWNLKSQSTDVLVWERRTWPLAVRLGVVVLIIFAIAVLNAAADEGGDATPLLVLIVGLAIVLGFVRRTEAMQMAIAPSARGTSVTVTGQADLRTRRALEQLRDAP